MKNVNNFTQWKKWIGRCDVRARDHAPKAPRAVWAQSGRSLGAVRGVQWTFSIHSAYLLKSQSESKKLSWSVWMYIMHLWGRAPQTKIYHVLCGISKSSTLLYVCMYDWFIPFGNSTKGSLDRITSISWNKLPEKLKNDIWILVGPNTLLPAIVWTIHESMKQNIQNLILIHDSRTTRPIKFWMPFLNFSDNLHQNAMIFQKSVSNFEIEHKTC